MKLNYKRTILIGFAFFLIMAFWQAYEVIVPLMLVNKFGLNQTLSGIIMALDNVLAVFLLPIFGALSDKSTNKRGKRTPYIFIGTLLAIVTFIGLSFADNAQLAQIKEETGNPDFRITLFEENPEVANVEKEAYKDKELASEYSIKDYAAMVRYNKKYNELTDKEEEDLKDWYCSIDKDDLYYYDYDSTTKTKVYRTDLKYDEVKKVYIIEETGEEISTARMSSTYSNLISSGRNHMAWKITKENPLPLVFFIIILLMVLVSMAYFRSPAVALMPDITIKPLRSQGNAVINLMGTLGAMLVLILGILFGTGKVANQMASFTWYIVAVCGIMLAGLIIFIFFVKEPKWAAEMVETSKKLGIETESDEIEDLVDSSVKESSKGDGTSMKDLVKKDRSKFISLMLLLFSVVFWFTSYNAASSKYSLYATNILHKDYNMTLLMAQAVAILSFIPAGWVSSKIGRKKSIIIGTLIMTVVFTLVGFFDAKTPSYVINIIFSLGGIGWAAINVNSFPMVVELAKGGDVGKYTGYYYTASMAAQIVTPVLSGVMMDIFGSMKPLFFYCSFFMLLSIPTMMFVRHGDNLMIKNRKKQEKAQANKEN